MLTTTNSRQLSPYHGENRPAPTFGNKQLSDHLNHKHAIFYCILLARTHLPHAFIQFVNWCTVYVWEGVCVLSSMSLMILYSILNYPTCPSYCWTNTKQIVCKGHGGACAGSSAITSKANLLAGLGFLFCPGESKVTEFVWKFRCLPPCTTLNSYLYVDSFFKGRGREWGWSQQRYQSPRHVLLRNRFDFVL